MSILQAIILGLIQGLTEFIPVSSSGHLVLAHHALGVFDAGLAFDVALHFGTLLALIGFFWKDLVVYAEALVKKSESTRVSWLLIAATIPAVVIGFLLQDQAESQFRSIRLVGFTMFSVGGVMLLAEYMYKRQTHHAKLKDITTKQALIVGFTQAAAIVPGVSRSGSTITAGMFTGLNRVAATRFAFLLGIPITAGAILKIFTGDGVVQQFQSEQGAVIVGIITAFLSGLFAIRFMLRYLSKHGLQIFGYYRLVVGGLLLLVFSLR